MAFLFAKIFNLYYNFYMLQNLKIKNVAVVSDASIDFIAGLNIISGETGAGKSIILDALNLVLGAKADKALIKSGEDFLKVEATFNIENVKEVADLFNELDLEFEDCLIISRKITIEGKSEARLNGKVVPLSYLKTLSSFIIDIHSQNENYILLNKQKQLQLIDDFAKVNKTEIANIFRNLQEINGKILDLDKDETLRQRELELLNFQINEIESAKIKEGEEQELENELVLLKNSEKINNSVSAIKEIFEYGNFNILSSLKKAENELNVLNNLNVCEELCGRLSSANIEINDIYSEILDKYSYEFNEERYSEIDNRLDLYKKLHRKYGLGYIDIINFLNLCKEKREKLENFEEELFKLKKEKEIILKKAYEACVKLSKERKEACKFLETAVLAELKELSMPNAQIVFKQELFNEEDFENKFTINGADNVEILFSANLGENVKPLGLVASGGEISRLMLAIKTVVTKIDQVPTIIFDELDVGISGEASINTAKKLAKISRAHQVVAISHLLQICSMADRNILVKKQEENGKTISSVNVLKAEETVLELCRFMSVDGITENTLKHAQEVKDYCENYKKSL